MAKRDGKKRAGKETEPRPEAAEESPAADPRGPGAFRDWFDEAWGGWIRPVGLIAVVALLWLGWKLDLISERSAGLVVVAAVILGTGAAALLPAWPLVQRRSTGARGLFGLMVLCWFVGAGWPAFHAARPFRPLGEVQLRGAALTNVVDVGTTGPFEVSVAGHFKHEGGGEVEAPYSIEVKSTGVGETISGALKRVQVRARAGRRGGVSVSTQERTENVHRLDAVPGPQLTFAVEGLDDQLSEEGLFVTVRRAGPHPMFFWMLAGVAVLLAIGFDAFLGDARLRQRTYLSMALGIGLVFSINYPSEATPHSLVKPAIGSLLLAVVVGGIGAYLLSAIVRLAVGPKRKAPAKR